ncbi:HvfC/BufC N-terminal domain-containing protein [Arhodomonas sp. AD133]|uniref:HvfC/BufC N-terminal domain-containing protein n=1 Tax=Arhodomonas sp. AD133 TaxID=3415009 RepID=UPI003EBD9E3E
MASLADSQGRFVAALRDPEAAVPPDLAGRAGEMPEKRFGVYRNNVHVSLVEAVRATYPVTERLVGEAFFHGMARTFVGESLPTTPVLLAYGGGFPAFIRGFEPARTVPYLADVAALEWARHEAYHAVDETPLAADALAAVAPEALASLHLTVHASARVVESPWPVHAIWETNAHDETVRPVDLHSGGEAVLVMRPYWEVTARVLGPGEATFIRALAAGEPLPAAVACAEAESAEFDLTRGLGNLLAAGGVSGYRTGES